MKKIIVFFLVFLLIAACFAYAVTQETQIQNTQTNANTASAPVACTMDYNPVCGKDGVTYSNRCIASSSNVALACAGECPCQSETNADCKNLYWIDKNNRECGYKQFCGMYMYFGLEVFTTKEECIKAVSSSSVSSQTTAASETAGADSAVSGGGQAISSDTSVPSQPVNTQNINCAEIAKYMERLKYLNQILVDSQKLSDLGLTEESVKAEMQNIYDSKGILIKQCDSQLNAAETKQTQTKQTIPKPVLQDCVVSDDLQNSLNSLLMELKTAEEKTAESKTSEGKISGEEIALIKEKISAINGQMKARKEKCSQRAAPVPAAPSAANDVISSCIELKKAEDDFKYCNKKIEILKKSDNGNENNSDEKVLSELKAQCIRHKARLDSMNATIGKLCNEGKENLGQLVSDAVKNKEGGTKDIVAYYKAKISEFVSSESDSQTQIQSLKALRDEIDHMILELIKNQKKLNASDVATLVNEIKVSKKEISADGVKVDSTDNVISIDVNGDTANIQPTATGASIESGGVTAIANEISYENGSIKVDGENVAILPDEIAAKVNAKIKSIKIEKEKNNAVYNVETPEKRKLFALIPVEVNKEIVVDATTGIIVSENRPWWTFTTSKVKIDDEVTWNTGAP